MFVIHIQKIFCFVMHCSTGTGLETNINMEELHLKTSNMYYMHYSYTVYGVRPLKLYQLSDQVQWNIYSLKLQNILVLANLLSVFTVLLFTSLRYLDIVSSRVVRRLASFGRSWAALGWEVKWSIHADTRSFCTSCWRVKSFCIFKILMLHYTYTLCKLFHSMH